MNRVVEETRGIDVAGGLVVFQNSTEDLVSENLFLRMIAVADELDGPPERPDT
jgi:hypothetical protein